MVIFSLCKCLCAFTHVFFFYFGGPVFCFLPLVSEKAANMKVCHRGDKGDRASRQRGVGRSQEELSSSNRQRAKRMTVPSSSPSVNMIMLEPSWRSKACHTACKTVTVGAKQRLKGQHDKGGDATTAAMTRRFIKSQINRKVIDNYID